MQEGLKDSDRSDNAVWVKGIKVNCHRLSNLAVHNLQNSFYDTVRIFDQLDLRVLDNDE